MKRTTTATNTKTTNIRTPLQRTWSSRHTGRAAVGPVHDLVLNDILSWLLPTHPLTHAIKFVVVVSILTDVVVPTVVTLLLAYTTQGAPSCRVTVGVASESSSSLSVPPLWRFQRFLLERVVKKFVNESSWNNERSTSDNNDEQTCYAVSSTDRHHHHPSTDDYMSDGEYTAWLVGLTLLTVTWYTMYQRRILYLLWHRPLWMDPTQSGDTTTTGRGRLPAYVSTLRFFTTEQAARAAACHPQSFVHCEMKMKHTTTTTNDDDNNSRSPDRDNHPATATAATPNVYNLDSRPEHGHTEWQFQLCATVQEGLAVATQSRSPEHDTKSHHLPVPSNWMMSPDVDDIPMYTNQKYPIPCEPPLVPHANPTGVYRRTLPRDFLLYPNHDDDHPSLDRYWITLHGAESMAYVFLNGQQVGFCKDSRYVSSFDKPLELPWNNV